MIKFECLKCGNCCRNNFGWVYVSVWEIKRISDFLNMSVSEFAQKYLIKDRGWFVLSGPNHNKDCFFENNLCKIYNVRPKFCQEYPLSESILENRQTFLKEAEICLGLKHLLQQTNDKVKQIK